MKKILIVLVWMMSSPSTTAQRKPIIGTKLFHDMEVLTFNGVAQFGNRTQLVITDSIGLSQSTDTTLFLTKFVRSDTLYFGFFQYHPPIDAWLKIAETPVIADEDVDTIFFSFVDSPLTKGPLIVFGRTRREGQVLHRYFLEEYWVYFKKWDHSVR